MTVQRADQSVVTGFVDRAQGVVYDWVVVTPAPKPEATYENEEYEGEEYEGDEHENEDHEGDEHGDDDDD